MSKAGTLSTAEPSVPAVRLPRRRGVELALIVVAVLLSVYGYCAVGLARTGSVPPGAAGYGAGLGALALVAHLAVRRRAPYADPLPLPIGVLLNGLGLVLIYRLDLDTPGDRTAPAQLVWSTLGVAFFIVVVVALRDHRVLQRYAYVCVTAALALLILPILFPAVNGARIWIRIAGFSLQPGEFAKVLLAVFFAAYLAANRAALAYSGRQIWRFERLQLPTGRVLGPILAIWLVSVGVLILERDLGTSLLFFGLFVVMLYVATGRTGWIAVGLVLAALGAVAVGRLEPHVAARIQDWLHPFASIEAGQGPNQLAQSLFAFAAGGMLGTGLGLGHSPLIGFAVKSDFILATAGEELGLAGLSAVFLLYGLLVERGFRAGLALRDPFGRLLAVGLSSLIALQVFVIAGGVTGLIPLTGMAMPFLAQGGSSVVTNWAIVALLIRLSDSARRPGDGGSYAADGTSDLAGRPSGPGSEASAPGGGPNTPDHRPRAERSTPGSSPRARDSKASAPGSGAGGPGSRPGDPGSRASAPNHRPRTTQSTPDSRPSSPVSGPNAPDGRPSTTDHRPQAGKSAPDGRPSAEDSGASGPGSGASASDRPRAGKGAPDNRPSTPDSRASTPADGPSTPDSRPNAPHHHPREKSSAPGGKEGGPGPRPGDPPHPHAEPGAPPHPDPGPSAPPRSDPAPNTPQARPHTGPAAG